MKVTYISDDVNGDWAGVYFDGELIDQNHSLNPAEILASLYEAGVIEYEHLCVTTDDAWDKLGGQLPEEFEEIPEGLLE